MKPYIFFSKGWWRVSHMPKPFNPEDRGPWSHAHNFAYRLNHQVRWL